MAVQAKKVIVEHTKSKAGEIIIVSDRCFKEPSFLVRYVKI
eukprot:CAMPEP_0169272190 /NCGR_PEP_ID=MMETSP1016-20121227/50263_1 /TAXON_ID=342587 /ORGANISM="Karlodinium micrum, Strain CCMP2283" /LENGTH=40 /DNA_ID= /DNA_START= /DNA_END= /DNA_ORIENTATION=